VTGRLREAREIKRKARVRKCRTVPSRLNRSILSPRSHPKRKSQAHVEMARADIAECARRYHTDAQIGYIHTYMYTRVCTRARTYTHTRIHTYTHTHTHTDREATHVKRDPKEKKMELSIIIPSNELTRG